MNTELCDSGISSIRALIKSSGIDAWIVTPEAQTPTVELAAAAAGVSVDQIIKSVLFVNKQGDAVLAIANGMNRISLRALSAASMIAGLRLADSTTVKAVTGFPAGGVPPIGHRTAALQVVIDLQVMNQDRVLGGGGDSQSLISIRPLDIVAITGASVTAIAEPPFI